MVVGHAAGARAGLRWAKALQRVEGHDGDVELGGNAPHIVFSDADLDVAVPAR